VPENFARKVWARVQSWFVANAEQVTWAFIADEDGEPVMPNGGYLRILFAEGFLAQQKTWGNKQFPALHGGVSLNFLGGPPATFSTFGRPPEQWTTPGAHLDYPMTMLLPFTGGTVEIEAALYEATVDGPLGTAVDLISSLASLMGPPLSVAAQVADKVSDGLDRVLAATGNQPVLGLHATMVSPNGGASTTLRPGYLVVLGAPEKKLAGTPVIHEGRLHLRDGERTELPTGVDYLVIRVDCRADRDDWRFPELDALIRSAGEAFIRGQEQTFADLRKDAIARAWNSPDLIPADRKRVALLVKEELDGLGDLGAVPSDDQSFEAIAPRRLRAPDDDALRDLTLARLLA
jgi:hypothetical protein